MKNTQGFIENYPPHTGYYVDKFDSAVNSGDCSIGVIDGEQRQIKAIIALGASDQDLWKVVNLKQGQNHFDSIAVLGVINDEDAKNLAHLHYGRMFDCAVESVASTNMIGLKHHLSNPLYENRPIQQWQLDQYQNILTNEVPMWDSIQCGKLTSHQSSLAHLMLDLRRNDHNHELLQSFDGLAVLLQKNNIENTIDDFDSIVTHYQDLEKTTHILHSAMEKVAKVGNVKVEKVELSKPFKRNNVVQIAAVYYFDDGQAVSIFFHNPDSTPAKLQADDLMMSWKIQLNNRDVTGLIQPGQAKGFTPNVFASRIMQVVNKNSASFKRAQAKKAEVLAKLAEMQTRIADKQTAVEQLDQQISDLNLQIDRMQAESFKTDRSPISVENTPQDTTTVANESDVTDKNIYINQVDSKKDD